MPNRASPKLPSDVLSDKEWNSDYANHWYIADVSDGSDHPKAYTPGTDGLKPSASATEDNTTVEVGSEHSGHHRGRQYEVRRELHHARCGHQMERRGLLPMGAVRQEEPSAYRHGHRHRPLPQRHHRQNLMGVARTPSALRKPSATATAATRSRPTTSTMATTSMWSRRSMPPKPRASPAREPAIISRT